ncbi:MAG: CoA pyrophosphatase [Lachnospiraceae bacterium]|nr:CoA pyrophosphatase [Lachnospiraceae bacterium]
MKAAVLLPLLHTENGTEIVLERRALHLKHQPGELCLPGGSILEENGVLIESPEEAAVRETMEELQVSRGWIGSLQPLPVQMGPDGGKVYPFAAALSDYHDTFSEAEVAEVLRIPADFIRETEPERYAVDLVTVPREGFPYERIPGGRAYPFRKKEQWIFFYDYQGVTIWGLTAKILESWGRQPTE